MEDVMNYPHLAPCLVCVAKTSTATKYRPCSGYGCTVNDPHGVLSDAEHSGVEDLEQFLLSFPTDEKSDDSENGKPPPKTEWTTEEFKEFCKSKKLA